MVLSADGRFPLSFYFRVANQIVEQAKVCREEGELDDLYLILNRYVRLVSEVIPQHWSYSKYSSNEKLYYKKILQEFSGEIENLKPLVGGSSDEISEQLMRMTRHKDDASNLTSQRRDEKDQAFAGYNEKVADCSSIRLGHSFESIPRMGSIKLGSGIELDAKNTSAMPHASFHNVKVYAVRHFFSSVESWIENLPVVGQVSHVDIPESRNEHLEPSCGESSRSNDIQDVHISGRLMEEFMELAKENTEKNLETCGILGAFLKNQTFYVTTLIVPKQESTSSSCQALNEEEIHAILQEQSLFPAGWIHTHPSQTCFLSSIDVHTQYSYQVMLPEAVAIVMAPTDPARSYGIFRLTDPGGITVIRECNERGFHQHSETSDGSPIYESCSNIYFNPHMRFEIVDLRRL